ncbi:Endonuclease-reverse transcriptase [Popillia japonica]|uniref:Endonuclease-reverse transcriptase n=1 Tax=Popillia japonica TaxID=7064 RepID=A0AAW1I8C0_POPJA
MDLESLKDQLPVLSDTVIEKETYTLVLLGVAWLTKINAGEYYDEQLNQNECTHSDEQRAVTDTWVIDEVRKSIEKGYSVLEIYEVWKYQVVTEKEGVKLNPDKIAKNPGLRQVGKAVITSFWSKLGQRENQSKTTIVNEPAQFFSLLINPTINVNTVQTINENTLNEPAQFFSLLINPTINVNTVQTINENTLVVNWQHNEEVYEPLPTVNICLAAYTTAQGRLKLYSYPEKLGERVLYYDSDSFYISRVDRLTGGNGGVAVLVKKELQHVPRYVHGLHFLESAEIKIPLRDLGGLLVYSVYAPPSGICDWNDLRLIFAENGPALAAGDFNAKHSSWGCRVTKGYGRKLYNHLPPIPISVSPR